MPSEMRLVLIEPDEPGQDELLFECVACGQEVSVVFRSDGGPRRVAMPTGPESLPGMDRDVPANALRGTHPAHPDSANVASAV
jgi:hypothetical protein